MSKYQKYFTDMMDNHRQLFDSFKVIHDNYEKDWRTWQDQFNSEGRKVVDVIREYEQRLCSQTEKGMYSKYSANLSDKFWDVVRKYFPSIDFVGTKRM